MALKLCEHASAVCGFQYFRKYWKLTPNQVLACLHKKGNPYDFFAIKVCDVDKGVAPLPIENSRALRFLLDREARITAVLTSKNYCVSPLVQGGLEIHCRVEISMLPTKNNKQIMDIWIFIRTSLICITMKKRNI